MPAESGADQGAEIPRYGGEHRDGFGNFVTVHAVANPHVSGHEPARLHDHVPGYGIVRFRRPTREIVVECWPRWVDPSAPRAEQYPGWPITIDQRDGYGRVPLGYLPPISVEGLQSPVIRVIAETTGEIVYALRVSGARFRPWVYESGAHTVEVGDPDTGRWKQVHSLHAGGDTADVIEITFE
jgi:hypothetical protein